MTNRLLLGVACLAVALGGARPLPAAEPTSTDLFARPNLVAWCIVPFDSKKRGPEERAAMLAKLGFSKFAYDYRAEHIPTFDQEIECLKRHKVELSAWWFPTALNDEAKMTLAVFEKHKVTPQLWVTGGGGPTKDEADQRARVIAEAGRIRPIAEAAAKVGCQVALYNHGGWFGEPENQIAVIQELKLPNVGIVYNQHHGHDHIDRFAELLQKMKPYLLCLNLNGMTKEGDRKGQKIMQLGEGDLDLKLLKVVKASGYTGPIGILGHTQDDAEERLHDNLDGLDWLLPQLDGKPAGAKPKMRTPVPKSVAAAAAVAPRPIGSALVEGKFGKALDGRSGGALVKGRDEFRQFPLTVECWTKLADKSTYNILVAHEPKSSGTHWELFSMPGGAFTVYLPGFAPDHCRSDAMLCDDKWHHVAMVLELERVRLFVDGKQVADQKHKRSEMKSVPGELGLATLIERVIGCTGLVDEVRLSKGVRVPTTLPDKPFAPDESTLALWHLDELVETKRLDDATSNKNAALVGQVPNLPESSSTASRAGSKPAPQNIDGHWSKGAVGFDWTEADSRDDRFGQMDVGPFLSTSLGVPLAPAAWHDPVYKAIVVRVGSKRQASISYDTELLRATAGWTGFVRFDPARFGIIGAPRPDGPITFVTPSLPGWSLMDEFPNFRADHRYGPLPKEVAHYEGLYRHGQRVVLSMKVDGRGLRVKGQQEESSPSTLNPRPSTFILETPWLEETADAAALTRTLLVGPSGVALKMLVADPKARVRSHPKSEGGSVGAGHGGCHVLTIEPHDNPVTIKLFIASADTNEAAFDKLVATSPAPEDVLALTKPGPTIWGEPLVTKGEVAGVDGRGLRVEGQSDKANEPVPPPLNSQPSTLNSAYVIDTITLPFKNPFNALLFCGGHDFLPDGRAAVCTLHGDVWIVDGIDEKLERITWRRFATGLFQPLGVKVVEGQADLSPLAPALRGEGPGVRGSLPTASSSEEKTPHPNPLPARPGRGDRTDLFIIGRDQITRLHDLNNDGEADYYENFNNDAHTTMNGHEYVACLEADRAGNLYYVKGNCNSATPHDGSVLRVSADGSNLDVFATGFRNPNGMGMGPNDELTVAPQEGEWTPASGLFVVREGGFYGMMSSHHQATPPTDFIRPLCWFSRRDDNSCGGQVWATSDKFGPLSNQLLHMSFGQCKLRLVLREEVEGRGLKVEGQTKSSDLQPSTLNLRPFNGGSVELPLSFASGIHRGRMNPRDGQLYLTGLKGWVSSAVNDGCFQRVRYAGVGGLGLKVGQPRAGVIPSPPSSGERARVRGPSGEPALNREPTSASVPQSSSLDPQPLPLAMLTYRNGVALTFTGELDRETTEDPSSYQLEVWNYKWSAAYGSPDLKPSAPEQVGRDEVEPKSVTLLEDNRTVFIELPDLKPVDQLAVSYTLLTHDSHALEQTVTLTLNSIPDRTMPEAKLHRPQPSNLPSGQLSLGISVHSTELLNQQEHRMFAWSIPFADQSQRRESGPRAVRARAWLRVPATGEYRFTCEGTGTATIAFHGSPDAKQPLSETTAVSVRLKRGLNEIDVRYELPEKGDARFRLMWESNRFPREAIPATSLARQDRPNRVGAAMWTGFSAGQIAYQQHNCARCHASSAAEQLAGFRKSTPFALRGAPRLDEAGRRFSPAWLANWLVDPARLKHDSVMPKLILGDEPQTAVDLTAYLGSLVDATLPAVPVSARTSDDEDPTRHGSDLFEKLGCIACHTFTEPGRDDEWQRVSLHFTKAKLQHDALERFLLAPQRHHATSFMPDFRLTADEASSLATFIRQKSLGEVSELAGTQPGNIERGRRAFEQLRCGQCHTMRLDDKLPPAHLASVFRETSQRGCLATEADQKSAANTNPKRERGSPPPPRFTFRDETRESLLIFLNALTMADADKVKATPSNLAAYALSESLASLRCNACHARDDQRSLWPEIVAEEGSGRAVEAVPQLTWVGEKLQGPWIEKLLKGEIKQKPRPWLTARMPSFPAYAGLMSQGLAAEHGVAFEEPLPVKLDADQVEIGRQLTLRDGGLDCRQCHGIGQEQPRGDASTQIALGINFALARDRLRPEFALRQMLDPPRYDLGSRMPRFAPDLRTTAAKHIEGGDAKKQFEALKQFLWSVKVNE